MARQGYWRLKSNPDDPDLPAEFVMQRVHGEDGSYYLKEQFRYVHVNGEEWTIPDEIRDPPDAFKTDLASIPSLAGWLIPKDGKHTPAALVHDAMILAPGETRQYDGREVSAQEADNILRIGMQHLQVPFWRRWMIWSAVSLLTLWRSDDMPAPTADASTQSAPDDDKPPASVLAAVRFANRARMIVGLLALVVFGLFLLPDVLDFPSLASYPFLPKSIPGLRVVARWTPVACLWQTKKEDFLAEFLQFAIVLAVAAATYAAVWWRGWWRFGLFAAITVPLIAFPTAVGAVSYAIYWVIEFVISIMLLLLRRLGRDKGPVPASWLAEHIVPGRPAVSSEPVYPPPATRPV